jgi:uncharacterized protein YjbJ (UPF0337 family)
MNRDRIEGLWKQLHGKAREEWCRLVGDEWGMTNAMRDRIDGWNQEGRGISQEAAARQLKAFRAAHRAWISAGRGPSARLGSRRRIA